MLTFAEYIEKAKENSNLKNDKQVAQKINIGASALVGFRNERSYPSQETVLKLANLAGVSPEQALIDFNLWKTKDKPNAQKVWLKLAKMIGCLCLAIILFTGESKANTFSNTVISQSNMSDTIYIMYN